MSTSSGFLILDKPGGITSRRAVDMVQKAYPRGTRIGHGGTLDPLATGVLVVAIGQATRLIEYVQRMEKEYHAVITLGATSDTDDADGTITPVPDAVIPRRHEIEQALHAFVGEIEQVPPAYSAAHVDGQRAHHLARRGKPVDLAPRTVRIHEIQVLNVAGPDVEVTVRCGKGTYIRSLARDLGKKFGCGGYITSLRRTRIGAFTLPGVELNSPLSRDALALQPLETAVRELPRVCLDPRSLKGVGHGHSLPASAVRASIEEEVAVLDAEGKLHAIASWHADRLAWRPDKVFMTQT